jgi:hypothetical protein
MTNPAVADGNWRKSSYSQNNGGECVEWAPARAATTGHIPVRDSKNPAGPTLTFTPTAWSTFITALKDDYLTA